MWLMSETEALIFFAIVLLMVALALLVLWPL
jgi:hypothetical protein